MSQLTTSILETAAATSETCACTDPIPVERAKWKGAAVTICQRCGLRVPPRLR